VVFTLSQHGGRAVESSAGTENVVEAAAMPLATITVSNTNDSGAGSLRQAILDSNASVGVLDTIVFSIGTGPQTIALTTVVLPTITDPVIIDGTTQPGFSGVPLIELNGTGIVTTASGLGITAGSSTVRSLIINDFNAHGILLQTNDGNTITGCYIGTNAAGTAALGNSANGISAFSGSDNNIIGGLTSTPGTGLGNVISGNTLAGVRFDTNGNTVLGNIIGLSAAGNADLGNGGNGVIIVGGASNTVGGSTTTSRNIISGNTGNGVNIQGETGDSNTVAGNYLGTDITGAIAIPGTTAGVSISGGADNNTIGGSATAAGTAPGNVISGNNTNGINISGTFVVGAQTGNVVQGNNIGLNAAGTAALPNNVDGINITGAITSTTIGGLTSTPGTGLGNVISGNNQDGVEINGGTNSGISFLGNVIGLGPAGMAARPNLANGINLTNSVSQTIGGSTATARNIISGNGNDPADDGIDLGGNNHVIQGNFIGTDITGAVDLGNTGGGIAINAGDNNQIGGSTATPGTAPGNVVSGNNVSGIAFTNAALNNIVEGNNVGLNAAGTGAVGNTADGISVSGTNSGNRINGNHIFGNGSTANDLGIDLLGTSGTANGVNANDAGDPDTGPNTHQNFPIITSSTSSGGNTTITGTLNSTPSTSNFRIEFFSSSTIDTSGNGEGQTYLGFTTVNTDGSGNAAFSPTLTGVTVPAGHAVTATATDAAGNTSEFSTGFIGSFEVTNTNNSGAGSLRQAITDANAAPGVQAIVFNIAGAGVQTITPTSALPTITQPVIIDGYTQPGASENTLAVGNNAVLLIELNGTSAGAGVNGLVISAGNTTVRGLVINRFNNAISLSTNGNNIIEGNFIGTNPAGTASLPNVERGVITSNSNLNRIGGTLPAQRNVISGNGINGVDLQNSNNNDIFGNYIGTNAAGTSALANSSHGINVLGSGGNEIGGMTAGAGNLISGNAAFGVLVITSNNNVVQGNFIGTDSSGTGPLGNVSRGVFLDQGSSNNVIGGTSAAAANIIAFNGQEGFAIGPGGTSTGNSVLGNAIFTNGSLGIDLIGTNGIDANDAGDGDTGPNNLQNFPVLTSATSAGGNTTVAGTFNSTASTNGYRIEFFSNATCDASGNGEGRTFLGSTTVNTDGSGNVPINATLATATTAGEFITATATDPANNTSEFSACQPVVVTTLIVTNTDDTGAGSLRQAIIDSENTAGIQTITFNIAAAGVQTITLASALPTITQPVIIDGYTQPGASENTLPEGSDAVLRIELNGNNLDVPGLNITGGGTTVRGLVINRFAGGFGGDGIRLQSGGGNLISGCYIGTNAAGTGALGNSASGVFIASGSTMNMVGGNTPGARNVISANFRGVYISGVSPTGNTIAGNYIGTDKSGKTDRGNTFEGVLIESATNTVGGAGTGAGNLISGNGLEGVTTFGAGTIIQDNLIGTEVTGTAALPNRTGILINSASNTIGGTASGAPNLISGNNIHGIQINDPGSTNNTVQGNFIGTNIDGTAPVPNLGNGITLFTNADNNVFGGTTPAERNIISGNALVGIIISN